MFLPDTRNNQQIYRCDNPEDSFGLVHSRRISLKTNEKVKVKFTLEQATKARGGGGGVVVNLYC
jgi:hypothetical protein